MTTAGQGPRLLFLTGSGGDLRKKQTPLASPLVERFTVLTFDQRGMGQSDKPDHPYSMMDYASDAVAVLDAIGWDRVLLVGYSFGGMVAQEIVLNWPERVSRLVLAATTSGGVGGKSYPLETLSHLPPAERARRGLEIVDLSFTPEWQAAHPDEAQKMIKARMAAQARFADEPGHKQGRARQLGARAGHDTYDRLDRISVPTLVLAGTRDGQAPISAQRALADRIPDSVFETVDGGHNMFWQNPACYDKIAAFMEVGA